MYPWPPLSAIIHWVLGSSSGDLMDSNEPLLVDQKVPRLPGELGMIPTAPTQLTKRAPDNSTAQISRLAVRRKTGADHMRQQRGVHGLDLVAKLQGPMEIELFRSTTSGCIQTSRMHGRTGEEITDWVGFSSCWNTDYAFFQLGNSIHYIAIVFALDNSRRIECTQQLRVLTYGV